jgi:hypothetical protein
MGFRDVIAHQYFDLDEERVLLTCGQSLHGECGGGAEVGAADQRLTVLTV